MYCRAGINSVSSTSWNPNTQSVYKQFYLEAMIPHGFSEKRLLFELFFYVQHTDCKLQTFF